MQVSTVSVLDSTMPCWELALVKPPTLGPPQIFLPSLHFSAKMSCPACKLQFRPLSMPPSKKPSQDCNQILHRRPRRLVDVRPSSARLQKRRMEPPELAPLSRKLGRLPRRATPRLSLSLSLMLSRPLRPKAKAKAKARRLLLPATPCQRQEAANCHMDAPIE